ncbi:MAG: NAD(+)/NADH kinase [Lachnospiraceae bacterium]|nr:NAD(+)/NADH kinase [Lachnospiraceae bacterium]MBP3609935.1 NAD(+)/NADH kinase [Lachnospiraceae bacterium]
MDKFCIIVNKDRDEQLELTRRVQEFLTGHGKNYVVRMESLDSADEAWEALPEDTDCVIVLGGDGTLIRAANRLLEYDIPVFGINAGTLGYLTGVEASEAERGLERLCSGDFRVEKRMMLDSDINGQYVDTVLNEVAVTRSGFSRLINLAVYVNGALLDVVSGDGLLVATPTGSTGYNLSAGGPVVKPETELILITPICPHSLSSREIVVSAEDEIAVEIHESRRGPEVEACATFDGRVARNLKPEDRIVIKRSKYTTKMVQLDERTFFEVLRSKLGSVEK